MKERTNIRLRLQVRRDELAQRLDRIRTDRLHREAPLAADFAEQAVQVENDEVLDRLDLSTEAVLAQYEHALARFDAGRHGICECCGEAIPASRLEAVPQATTCPDCARIRERGMAAGTGPETP